MLPLFIGKRVPVLRTNERNHKEKGAAQRNNQPVCGTDGTRACVQCGARKYVKVHEVKRSTTLHYKEEGFVPSKNLMHFF